MIDFLFVTVFIMIPIIVYYLLKLSGVSLFHFSVLSFVTLSMLTFAYAGILPLYFGWNEYCYYIGVQNQAIILKMFACSSWTILTMVCGFIFCRNILNLQIAQCCAEIRCLTYKETFFICLLFILCLLVLALYLSKLPSIALVVAMNNAGADEIGAARSLMGNDFAGKYHRYSLFMRDALNIVTFAFFGNWLVKKGKCEFLLFIFAAVFAAFSAIMASEKGPFAWFLIGLFLVRVLVVSGGKYPLKSILTLTFGLFVFLILFYIYFMGTSEIGSTLLSILSRAFTGGIAPAYFYLEHFPHVEDFLLGRTLSNPGGLLPFEQYELTKEASLWINPEHALKGIVGSAPTVFWGELYANWGIHGVLLIPFIVGIGLFLISLLLNKLENTPLKTGLVIWLALHFKNLSETGISGFLLDTTLMVIVLLVLFVIVLAHDGRVKFKRNRRCLV